MLVVSGCEFYEQDEYQQYYVVESYLIADDFLPAVRLSTSAPIDEEYTFQKGVVSGADIEIRLLNPDSSVAETYSYLQKSNGVYIPAATIVVKPSRLYELHVTTPDNETITATTFVPGRFETVNELQNQYVYQSEEQIEVTTTPSSYITGRQSYYIFSINVVDGTPSDLTPFYRDLVFEQDNRVQNYFINSSGIINEGNYERKPNGNITLTVPWLAIAFYDSNDVIANTIDDNMYDFLRTQDAQTGGTTLSPGEIQNIRYNINGGIGIFGSMASDTNRVYISRPETAN